MNLADFTPGRRRRGVAMALLCSCLLFAGTIRDGGTDTVWTISTGYYVKDAVQNRTEYDRVREVLAQIPRDTGVAASTMFIAPLADCPELYDMDSSYPTGSPSYAYPGNLPESVTYVAIDLRYSNHRERYDNNAEWEKVTESAFVVVYHRK